MKRVLAFIVSTSVLVLICTACQKLQRNYGGVAEPDDKPDYTSTPNKN